MTGARGQEHRTINTFNSLWEVRTGTRTLVRMCHNQLSQGCHIGGRMLQCAVRDRLNILFGISVKSIIPAPMFVMQTSVIFLGSWTFPDQSYWSSRFRPDDSCDTMMFLRPCVEKNAFRRFKKKVGVCSWTIAHRSATFHLTAGSKNAIKLCPTCSGISAAAFTVRHSGGTCAQGISGCSMEPHFT